MQLTIETQADYSEIILEGRIDATSAPQFDSEATPALEAPAPVLLLNFEAVPYISSAGLRSVLKLAKGAQSQHKKLACFAMQPAVFEIFRLSGFTSIIKIAQSKEQACEAVK